MANPTTNFGWVMPTSTSLVTNLPADFNTFGQGVDTSMAQLKGGTTGQVLSKTSGTDMAFTWVTPTDQTPLTTKGDLFTFTTVDARLGVGTNGQILSANSATATGLEWITNDQGDITAVTAGTGISGGGTTGAVTITNSMATEIAASGDIIVGTGAGTFDNLPIGTTNQVLTADTTVSPYKVKWATPSAGMTNPLTTTGDTIYSSGGTTPARLGIGSTGQVLTVASGLPSWATPSAATTSYALINSGGTALTGAATITVSSLSGYNKFFVVIDKAKTATTTTLVMRFNGDTTSKYNTLGLGITYMTSGSYDAEAPNAMDFIRLGNANSSAQRVAGYLRLDGGNSSGIKTWDAVVSGETSGDKARAAGGLYTGTSVISSMSFINDAGGNFNGGTVYIYGAN